jgi:hypothetical protein
MNWFRKYGLPSILILAFSHQLLQKGADIQLPFLSSYLDDILCMPIFLSLWNWERQHLWNWKRLDKIDIVCFTLLVFLLFELILPRQLASCTADWWDGLAYAGGSSFYWWVWR